MAETTGLVQKLIVGEIFSCVWIGPTANNVEVLLVQDEGTPTSSAYAGSVIKTLAAAMTNYRAVVAVHGDSDAKITALRIEPV